MKAISRQGQQFRGNCFIAAPLRQALKNMGAKDFRGNGGGLGSGFLGATSLQNKSARVTKRFRIAKHSVMAKKRELEAELHGHRHHLERHVDLRTGQLMKRIALLESCNVSLGDKLALTQRELAALKQQLAAPTIRPDLDTQVIPTTQTIQEVSTNDCDEPLDGISDWVRNMIGWRVAAAGAIS